MVGTDCLVRRSGSRGGIPRGRGLRLAVLLTLVLAAGLLAAPGQASASPAPLVWGAPAPIDDQPPFAYPAEFRGVSCPSASLCVAVDVDGDVLVSTDPAGGAETWVRSKVSEDLDAVSCPSVSLCVAVGYKVIATSTDPTGGSAAWSTTKVYPSLKAVSCPTASLCVAADGYNGEVWTSTDPTGGAGAWSEYVAENGELTGLSCPTTKLCVAVDHQGGHILTSTNPTGGAGTWTVTSVAPHELESVSCASESLCVATGSQRGGLVSTEPTGGAGAWAPTPFNAEQVSCATWGLCVALNGHEVITSTEPTGGVAAWKSVALETTNRYGGHESLNGASCPDANLCVLVDSGSGVVTSTEPTGGAAAWTITPVAVGSSSLDGVSCASVDLCVWVDNAGNVVTSTDPTGGAGAWSEAHIDGHKLNAVSCPTNGFCVAVDEAGDVLTTTDPAGGAGAWSIAHVDGEFPLRHVSCASVRLCVAVDREGGVVSSDDPTGGSGAWRVGSLGSVSPEGVSCPSEHECVVVSPGDTFISYNPAGGEWTDFPGGGGFSGFFCPVEDPSKGLCFATGSGSEALVLAGRPPSSWGGASFELAPLEEISCAVGGGLCMATSAVVEGYRGDVVYSFEPAAGRAGWGESNVYGEPVPVEKPHGLSIITREMGGVACVAQGMCVVGSERGQVMVAVPQFATAPRNSAPPAISGTPAVGETLTCAGGAWSGEPAPIVTERWLRDGAAIPGADAGGYVVQSADEGHTLSCEVTAANGAGRASATTADVQIPVAAKSGGGGSGGGSTEGGSGGGSIGVGGSGGGSSGAGGGSTVSSAGCHRRAIGAPSNAFLLNRVRSMRGTVRVTLTLPGCGEVRIVSVRRGQRRRAALTIARASAAASSGGRVVLTLTPAARYGRLLATREGLVATLITTYTPMGGTARSIERTVVFHSNR